MTDTQLTDAQPNRGLERIAFLGTGTMGSPMARNLLDAGFPVTVWNREPERAEALAEHGGRVAASAAEAAEHAEVVITMIADGAATEEVMSGPGDALDSMQPGAVW